MRNDIVKEFPNHPNFTDDAVAQAVAAISAETGFVSADHEIQRRFIYDRNKTWRVRIEGTFQGKKAILRVENLKLEVDEEMIRQKFRLQAAGSKVRPPMTYATQPFDEAKGYAYSIDEFVDGEALFLPTMQPERPARDFVRFYRELRGAVTKPFWPQADADAEVYSKAQLDKWTELARSQDPELVTRHEPLLGKLRAAILAGMHGRTLGFVHPHLAGTDVRFKRAEGEYIVFANHFWGWRQPGYDLAFPIWGQWMALPVGHRTHENVASITDAWTARITDELSGFVLPEAVRVMLLNRVYGSLILDLPALSRREGETAESVAPLIAAFIAEGERLLA
ncbi:MAG: hypothetical protein WA001_04800 [Patescibacteria group bacterium]